MPWPQLTSGEDDDNYVERFGVDAFPTKLLIDPEGRILARHIGASDDLFSQLDALLGEAGAARQAAVVVADEVREENNTLTADEARALSRHSGTLYLSGVKKISDEVAAALAAHQGGLGLNGLVSLSDAAAASLAKSDRYLALSGLRQLSDDVAANIARQKGFLLLAGVTQLSDPAAAALAKHEGDVSLTGLQKLSAAGLKALQEQSNASLPPLDSVEVAPNP